MFNEILSTITKSKNDRLATNLDGREITKINRSKFKKEYNSIADDVAAIIQKPMFTRIQEKMVEILSLLKEIPEFKDKKLDAQSDTTNMSELESEEPAEQKGVGLKILTPSQMLSRFPISLAQLKAGNNSEKLKNKIRQLLYSLCKSKILTKKIINNLINTIYKWKQLL